MKSSQKFKAKFLSAYYGNPIKDMKLILVSGPNQPTTTRYIHEILKSANKNVAALAAEKPFNISMLHKFLSDAWKSGADYVVVTAPKKSVEDGVFYSLPIFAAVEIDQKPLFKTAQISLTEPSFKLLNTKNYKKGTELTLSSGFDVLTLATFLVGAQVTPSILAAATLARALNLSDSDIINGVANYDYPD